MNLVPSDRFFERHLFLGWLWSWALVFGLIALWMIPFGILMLIAKL
jgi:hypothetical protein